MRIAFIVAYFGKLPNYFHLFLNSCAYNPDYDWIIFTNDMTEYDYPQNVHRIEMNFDECKQIIQSKFDFPIVLHTPQKLCDYKCAYGMIFENYLDKYDWWGHCDLDQIFGTLNHFITKELLENNDKICSLGHLTLYRNTYENNRVFMNKLNGKERYKEVFSTEKGCAFDEWLPDNINEIFLNSGRPVSFNNIGADINSYRTTFQLVYFDIEKRKYYFSPITNSIFKWDEGCIYQNYMEKDLLQKKEFPYVHLQKRKMTDKRKIGNSKSYYIIPNSFIDGDCDMRNLLNRMKIWEIINYQFLKVKWSSLKYRFKNRDWNFSNVFKA